MLSRVSMIIPAYNCEKTISKTLSACLKQDYPTELEVIVVDDGSSDQTAEIIRKFKTVRYFYQENAGPAAARNTGAGKAKGEFLLFTDSDCVPHSDWVNKLICGFSDSSVGAVMGSYGIANPSSQLANCVWQEILFRHKRMPEYPRAFGSYNVCIRRKVFQQAGGFDTRYRHASGEDNDLSYQIIRRGNKIRFEKEALVDHFHQEQLARYLQEQYRHGVWRARMYLSHPNMMPGDDYTFWKDSVEVGLAFLSMAFFVGTVMSTWSLVGLLIALIALFTMQLCFAFVFLGSLTDRFYFSFVMFSRAFARALGFLNGLAVFIFRARKSGQKCA